MKSVRLHIDMRLKKQCFIWFVAVLGFFMMPTAGLACESGSEHAMENCCDGAEPSAMHEDAQQHDHTASGEQHDDCGTHCADRICHCPATCADMPLAHTWRINQSLYADDLQFTGVTGFISSGFYSIWLPPKIA